MRAAKAAVWAAVDLPMTEGLRREHELAALAQSERVVPRRATR
jgi:hypothetical protein